MQRCNVLLFLGLLLFLTTNSVKGASSVVFLDSDDGGTEIELIDADDVLPPPPPTKPIPKSIKIPTITAWYYQAEGVLQILTVCPQGALVVCIENQNGVLVHQQTVDGNLSQILLYPELAPGTYRITIYSTTTALYGRLEVR